MLSISLRKFLFSYLDRNVLKGLLKALLQNLWKGIDALSPSVLSAIFRNQTDEATNVSICLLKFVKSYGFMILETRYSICKKYVYKFVIKLFKWQLSTFWNEWNKFQRTSTWDIFRATKRLFGTFHWKKVLAHTKSLQISAQTC